MAEVILFNHIPKTAGTTMKHVLWRAIGTPRVLISVGEAHGELIPEFAARLDRNLDRRHAIVTHVGFGVERWLPARHSYPAFTFLRDPISRTLSRYWQYRLVLSRTPAKPALSLEEWLDDLVLHRYNAQTGFLSGLWTSHYLEGAPLTREQFDRQALGDAKRNLESHQVVGLTERFDESMLLLRDRFGWPLFKSTYRRVNVISGGSRVSELTGGELEAVRAANELDLELYEFGRELFESQLATRCPDRDRRLHHYRRANTAYTRLYPATIPARRVVRSLRRA
jgi:hypothetical protein